MPPPIKPLVGGPGFLGGPATTGAPVRPRKPLIKRSVILSGARRGSLFFQAAGPERSRRTYSLYPTMTETDSGHSRPSRPAVLRSKIPRSQVSLGNALAEAISWPILSRVAVALRATVPRTECAGYLVAPATTGVPALSGWPKATGGHRSVFAFSLVPKLHLGTPPVPREIPFRANLPHRSQIFLPKPEACQQSSRWLSESASDTTGKDPQANAPRQGCQQSFAPILIRSKSLLIALLISLLSCTTVSAYEPPSSPAHTPSTSTPTPSPSPTKPSGTTPTAPSNPTPPTRTRKNATTPAAASSSPAPPSNSGNSPASTPGPNRSLPINSPTGSARSPAAPSGFPALPRPAHRLPRLHQPPRPQRGRSRRLPGQHRPGLAHLFPPR